MPVFNPQLITDPRLNPNALPPMPAMDAPAPVPVMPAPLAPAPAPVFVPVPIKTPVPKKGLIVTPEVARKAQGIYPVEQQAKQQMIDNNKTMPTPTGAWGGPS